MGRAAVPWSLRQVQISTEHRSIATRSTPAFAARPSCAPRHISGTPTRAAFLHINPGHPDYLFTAPCSSFARTFVFGTLLQVPILSYSLRPELWIYCLVPGTDCKIKYVVVADATDALTRIRSAPIVNWRSDRRPFASVFLLCANPPPQHTNPLLIKREEKSDCIMPTTRNGRRERTKTIKEETNSSRKHTSEEKQTIETRRDKSNRREQHARGQISGETFRFAYFLLPPTKKKEKTFGKDKSYLIKTNKTNRNLKIDSKEIQINFKKRKRNYFRFPTSI